MSRLRALLARPEIPSLNGLRALAVLAVIAYHGGYRIFGMTASGGVMLFFVLSGFLITWLLLQERERHGDVSLANFYIRRSLRILPAYLAYIALIAALLLVLDTPLAWGHVLSCIFYYNNYYYALSTHTVGWLQHAWSLAVEEQFYLVWPVAVLLLAPRRRLAAMLCVLIPALWLLRIVACQAGAPERYVYRAFEMRADQLLVGCLLAVVVHGGRARRLMNELCRPWVGVVAVALLEVLLFVRGGPAFRLSVSAPLEALLFAVILVQAVLYGAPLLERAPLRYLGRISYGLYLYHELGYAVADRLGRKGTVVYLAIAVAATIVLAALSFHLFEQPLLRLKSRLQLRRTASRPLTARVAEA